ncbi:inactive transglutaminase family protein [Sansalvadorimonas verongulae]|uniref:inactive transglutaminase family protein n=1 Tax=Sansalvadorimonas verongulae TaxID=2172824 RepID=UPI0012BC256F|nr:inactive transglutaminase family protein [Sansalvadorimonas verongulae]MTI12358.1 hypothetical protein [Sansalvadorimonas verongulae]
MNSNKKQVLFVVMALVVLGLSVAIYKNVSLGFPFFPGESALIWDVEAKVTFKAEDGPAMVSLAMPEPGGHYSILDSTHATPGYGFRSVEHDGVERVEWTRRTASGQQNLYYKIKVQDSLPETAVSPGVGVSDDNERVAGATLYFPELEGAYRVAADNLIDTIRAQSSDDLSFASLLISSLNETKSRPNAAFLNDLLSSHNSVTRYTRVDLIMKLLQDAGLPVRKVRGVMLENSRRNQPLVDMVEVLTGKDWHMLNPQSGAEGMPKNFMPWQRGGVSLLDITGGHNSRITFSALSRSVPVSELAVTAARHSRAALVDFSLYSLPIEEQNAYRYILLVPIGTLIVVLMRILVGLKTSGTFMPVLISLAFLQTRLLPGVVIFVSIVSIGLWIRFVLSRLNLLLVARISSVVIVVIGIMAGMSVLSYKMGIQQSMSVTFFPMIILAWTIERMSILWEEEGPMDVLISGGGSLLVAVLSYVAMTNRFIEHLTFNFPELLLCVLGFTLLLGQYTGYRLLELRRFRPMVED